MNGSNMNLYLPDTNIFIYALGGKQPYAQFLRTCITSERLGISVIVMAEFLSGGRKKEADAFERLVSYFEPLSVTAQVARIGANYRKKYKKDIKLPDALIAASCKVHEAILVSNNLQDFPMDDIRKRLLK